MQKSNTKNTPAIINNFISPNIKISRNMRNSEQKSILVENKCFINELNEKENKSQLPINLIKEESNVSSEKSIIEKKQNFVNLSIDNSKNVDFDIMLKLRSCFKRNSKIQKKKLNAYEFLINYFNKRLDLIYYFKRLNKSDLINSFFFTKMQNKTFDYLEKPNIFIDGEISSYEIYEDKSAINDIIKHYKDKVKDENLDYYDQKLLKLLPEKIRFNLCKET
jgi:hypothetical protein